MVYRMSTEPGNRGVKTVSTSSTILHASRIVVAKEIVSCDLAGEAAILNLQNGVYYGLDPVGARIWNLIQESSKTVTEIRDTLLEEYEVEPERCEGDLLALLQKLADAELIEVKDATAA